MKKIKFLAVALAAFTMFSCTNDEVENLGNNVPGEQAVLTIKLKGDGDNQAQSRAAGPATDTEDAVINNYLVFLFRDGGALDCAPHYSVSGAAVQSAMVLLPQRKRMWWPIRAHWLTALLKMLKRKATYWRRQVA